MSHVNFIDNLQRNLYGEDPEEDLSSFRSAVQQLLNKHFPEESTDVGTPSMTGNAQLLGLLQQMVANGAVNSATSSKSKKGPKKGSVNYYHVWLQDECDYKGWKEDNPDKSYQDFQKAMSPAWAEIKTNPEKVEELKQKAIEKAAATSLTVNE